ncbi:MAG: GH1 family beta-glucosidase [Gaiellaceae bacterium]
MKRFPENFLWGTATSAFQIEGALDADGRGPSIWDTFSGENGDTGEIACDHYRRWRADIDLLAELGVNAYRFSIAWPRLFPTGAAPLEPRGLEHYDRLIDALLERGIEPVVTLFHWDLPQALQDRGGWRSRETVDRFADYARICFDAYGDRVRWWVTQNEPWVHGILGHYVGMHAPGEQDLRGAITAIHHILLSHGRAVQELRASGRGGDVGIAFSLFPTYPESDAAADREAARICDGYHNRWFLDAVLRGSYPEDMRALFEERIGSFDFVQDRDLDTISAGSDFVGVNYYSRGTIRAEPGKEPLPYHVISARELDVPLTDGGYEIAPFALTDLLVRIRADYGEVPILITENGAIYDDAPHDPGRVAFLEAHLAAVHDAIAQGVPVRGYCHWSFMDNFEWALGYEPRFGLVHVDYDTFERTIKDSGRAYGEIARGNGL